MMADNVFLRGWARQIAARFGHPVWLVGSATSEENPRDVDVRVVLPDDEFEARYGPVDTWHLWLWNSVGGTPTDMAANWGRDVAKLSRSACLYVRLNIDFQVIPLSEQTKNHADKPRVRLDDLDLTSGRIVCKDCHHPGPKHAEGGCTFEIPGVGRCPCLSQYPLLVELEKEDPDLGMKMPHPGIGRQIVPVELTGLEPWQVRSITESLCSHASQYSEGNYRRCLDCGVEWIERDGVKSAVHGRSL